MRIHCCHCGRTVTLADTGALPEQCPHCRERPAPERLGRFEVERLLAAGGMGEVYLARHRELGTRVALKVLATPPGTDTAGLEERFRREAVLTAAIDHPGVVHVLDLAEEGGRTFLVLEYVAGRSLRSLLRDGPLPVGEALATLLAVADTLAAAHARGVVHRDLKPENVMRDEQGRVRVLDFGVARALQGHEPLTRSGELVGTPEYMAPEQLLDGEDAITARTDVHGLGVLGFELLTERSPFQAQNLFTVLKLVESLVPPSAATLRGEVPPWAAALLERALQKEPAARFADAGEVAAALREGLAADDAGRTAGGGALQRGGLRRARRTAALAALAVVALSAAVAVGWALGRRGPLPADPVGDAAVDPGRQAALAQLLAAPAWDAGARWSANDLATAREPEPPLVAADALARGRLRLRLGAPLSALLDLERAARAGEPSARVHGAVAWHCATLLPTLLAGAPCWLAAVDLQRRDRLLRAPGEGEADDPLLQAGRELAQDDAAAAFATLQRLGEESWQQEHAALALLAARRAAAAPDVFATFAARIAARFSCPLVDLAAATDAAAAANAFAAVRDGLAPAEPDRWLAAFHAAWLADGAGAAPRLRGLAEGAWLCGAGDRAPIAYAFARASSRLPHAREQDALHELLLPCSVEDAPAALALRVRLCLAAGDAHAARRLLAPHAAGIRAQPWLAPFAALAALDDAALAVVARLASGAIDAAAALDRDDSDPALCALAACCVPGLEQPLRDGQPQDGRQSLRERLLRRALRGEAPFALLPAFAPASAPGAGPGSGTGAGSGPMAEAARVLAVILREGVEGATAPAVRAAVRLGARHGQDLGELATAHREAIDGGVR